MIEYAIWSKTNPGTVLKITRDEKVVNVARELGFEITAYCFEDEFPGASLLVQCVEADDVCRKICDHAGVHSRDETCYCDKCLPIK